MLLPATSATTHSSPPGFAGGAIPRKGVVVVSRNRIRGPCGKGDVNAGDGGRCFGQQPLLDFASDLEITLHGDAVGQFERQEQHQGSRGNHGRGIPIGAKETDDDERQRQEQEEASGR